MITFEDFKATVMVMNNRTDGRSAFSYFTVKTQNRTFTSIFKIRDEIKHNLVIYGEMTDRAFLARNADVIEDLKNLWRYINEEITYTQLLGEYGLLEYCL